MERRNLVAMGGGGFSMEPDNPLLDDFALSLAGTKRPRVCFVPTASGDSPDYIARFREAFAGRAETCELALFARAVVDIAGMLRGCDVIYVGGGNTANMLAIWRAHAVDRALRTAWEAGVVIVGLSAGMVCWFRAGLTDSFGPELSPLDGLGWLPGSGCPHYDGEAERRPRYRALVEAGRLPPGIAVDDGCALHFAGTRLVEVVSSRPGAAAYLVDAGHEHRIAPRFLG